MATKVITTMDLAREFGMKTATVRYALRSHAYRANYTRPEKGMGRPVIYGWKPNSSQLQRIREILKLHKAQRPVSGGTY